MMIRLAALLLALAGCAVQAAEKVPLFEYQGKTYAVEDLSARMQQLHGEIMDEHYKSMRTLVDEMIFDVYVEQEAARQKRPIKDVGIELLEVAEITDDEVRNLYEQVKARINLPLDRVSDRLRSELKRGRILQQRAQLIERLKREGKFDLRIAIPPPARIFINTAGRPVRGEPSAPITIVEFGDYQCANCKNAVSVLQEILKKYPQDVKLVFMDFPINPSGISKHIAYGSVCAQNQGKYWAYHDAAFQSQSTLVKGSATKIAKQVGANMDTFEQCMQDRGTRTKVEISLDEGRRLGVNATPTLFVDGRPFPSNHLLQDLGAYIDKKKADKP